MWGFTTLCVVEITRYYYCSNYDLTMGGVFRPPGHSNASVTSCGCMTRPVGCNRANSYDRVVFLACAVSARPTLWAQSCVLWPLLLHIHACSRSGVAISRCHSALPFRVAIPRCLSALPFRVADGCSVSKRHSRAV